MPFSGALTAAAVIGGTQLLGGMMQADTNYSAAHDSAMIQSDAATRAAQSQLEAAKLAAEVQKFRPVGITNTFGSSNFQFDKNGYLTGAGYNLSPELKAMQDQIMAGARTNLSDAERLGLLGRGYLAANPQEVAQNWLNRQNALQAPQREQQLAAIRQNLFNTGRGGLSVSQGGALGAANPELQAYYNAIAQQDAQNALNAQNYGQQQLTFGQGLLSSAYAPFQSTLGTAANVEELGAQPFALGLNVGGRSAQAGQGVGQALLTGGTNAANTLMTGQVNAARTMQQANAQNPFASAITGLSQNPYLMNNLFGNQQQFNQNTGWSNGGSGQVQVPGQGSMSPYAYFTTPTSQQTWTGAGSPSTWNID